MTVDRNIKRERGGRRKRRNSLKILLQSCKNNYSSDTFTAFFLGKNATIVSVFNGNWLSDGKAVSWIFPLSFQANISTVYAATFSKILFLHEDETKAHTLQLAGHILHRIYCWIPNNTRINPEFSVRESAPRRYANANSQ